MRVVKIFVCLGCGEECVGVLALLNTVRISNTGTSNAQNNKVVMAPELHPSFYVLFI